MTIISQLQKVADNPKMAALFTKNIKCFSTRKTLISLLKNATFGDVFDPVNLTDKGTVTLPVSLVVGDAISGTEVLVFSVKKKIQNTRK